MRLIIILITLVTLVKLINLMGTPVFGDEGLYCYLGYQINRLPIKDSSNLVLNVWKDAPLLPLINAAGLRWLPQLLPLAVCRGAVVAVSGLGAMLLWLISGNLAAVVFYLINPFNFFMDRTILMDPVLNVAMLAYIFWSVKAIKTGKLWPALMAGGAAVVMLMAKQTGILVLPIPAIMVWADKKKLKGLKIWVGLTSVVVLAVVWLAVRLTKLTDTATMHTSTNLALGVLIPRLKANLWLIGNWLSRYWSWWIVPVLILARRQWRLGLIVIYFVLIFAAVGWTLFPRYLLIVTPFVALILAEAMKTKPGKVAGIILLLVWLQQDAAILLKPAQAQVARETRYQFFEDWVSGLGTRMAVEWLEQQKPDQDTLILVPQDIQGLWVMSQLSWAKQLTLRAEFYVTDRQNLMEYINRGEKVLIVATTQQGQLINTIGQEYNLKRLLKTHGDNRNSVTIDEVKK